SDLFVNSPSARQALRRGVGLGPPTSLCAVATIGRRTMSTLPLRDRSGAQLPTSGAKIAVTPQKSTVAAEFCLTIGLFATGADEPGWTRDRSTGADTAGANSAPSSISFHNRKQAPRRGFGLGSPT